MSIIRAYPALSDYKEPFVKLIVAFLEQVLHIDKSTVHDLSFEETYNSRYLASYMPSLHQEFAVTVRLSPPDKNLGDTIYLGMEYYGEYSISQMAFKPTWKLVKEQESEPIHHP